MRPWSRVEEAWLRDLTAEGKSVKETAAIMGRSAIAVRSRRRVLRIGRRRFAQSQIDLVKSMHANHTARQIAERLPGETELSVHRLIRRLDLPKKTIRFPEDTRDRIRELHARKMTDTEIGRELGIDRRYVAELRDRMGLKVHQDRLLESKRRGVQAQFAKLGIANRAGLRWLKHRSYAREHGLPEQLRFRAVQVAYCLARHGPGTRRQICERLGLRWKSIRNNGLNANGNWVKKRKGHQQSTYLYELVEHGIAIKLSRKLYTGKQGGNVSIYDLTPEWRERITHHVQQKSAAHADGQPA